MQESLYGGIDLHSSNLVIGMVDNFGKRVFQRRIRNDLVLLLKLLDPFSDKIESLTVESTYNWYWLVDGLIEYNGLKHADDKSDAFWLAEQLRSGILPTGYIYPKENILG